jgi:hypothetical protein
LPTRTCPSRESDLPRRLQPLLALLAIVSLDAQNPPQPQPPTFRTEANYVRVDIYPTKDDVPVSDLTLTSRYSRAARCRRSSSSSAS